MEKVIILQADNRPSLDFLLKTQEINKKYCEILGYEYVFIDVNNSHLHPATAKIHVVNDFLENTECDILVFLDSDAWIQNGYWLDNIIKNLVKNEEKHGCFSRDPYLTYNTYINSGSFIIKNNDFIKQSYKEIIKNLYENSGYHHCWPFDQYYISNYVFENKENFIIFTPEILNTPNGMILRHNWYKNKKMWIDLHKCIFNINNNIFDKSTFDKEEYYDYEDFPSINTIIPEYF